MKLAPLSGSLLDGMVQGSLVVVWQKRISLDGSFRGRSLNPAKVSPDCAGVVNLDLWGHAAWGGMPPLGEVRGNLLESRLHGRALTGEVHAGVSGSNLRIDRLALQGKGFALGASGELDRRLDFVARVSDLSGLVPGAAGALRTGGWLRWHEGRLSGAVTGHGRNLAAAGVRMAAVDLSARLGEGKGYPLHVAEAFRKPGYETFRADSATFEATGSLHSHTVHAALQSGEAKARLALAGSYRHGRWQREIASCSGQDAIGPWSLSSMSRKGNCWDNAPMESFFGTLKTELVHHRHYRTRAEAQRDIREYVEIFYNQQRRHAKLGYLSSAAFPDSYYKTKAA